ncbi:hypothetical protein EZS27_022469 [termite gut metagenome]|uniref:DUF5683 domain-containing protein n=1 Tax=termite gut metagenome TaxID=433724 RepID=A0A5J4R6D3_9ZZZZ
MIKRIIRHQLFVLLPLFLFIQTAGSYGIYAQNQKANTSDWERLDSLIGVDSLSMLEIPVNVTTDSVVVPSILQSTWKPNPFKATWTAIVFPGGGQIYNRKYWKLPIVYGGFAACLYGLNWNNSMYTDYSKAYMDIMDNNPNTNSFLDILPRGFTGRYDETYMKELLKKRKDMYRRYRDMTIFALIGIYFVSVVDAYVDAELSDFDISPDLGFRIAPNIINDMHFSGNVLGLQCNFTF